MELEIATRISLAIGEIIDHEIMDAKRREVELDGLQIMVGLLLPVRLLLDMAPPKATEKDLCALHNAVKHLLEEVQVTVVTDPTPK